MSRASKFSPEIRERLVKMVLEHQSEYESQWAAMMSVSAKVGCTAEMLRGWVRQHERDGGKRDGMTSTEKERIKALERKVRELRQVTEILRKASAYFAQAEFDRPIKR
jgi:transposase-like protein